MPAWRKIGNLHDPILFHDPIPSRAVALGLWQRARTVADENVELHRELQFTQDRLRKCRIALEQLALRAERAAGLLAPVQRARIEGHRGMRSGMDKAVIHPGVHQPRPLVPEDLFTR